MSIPIPRFPSSPPKVFLFPHGYGSSDWEYNYSGNFKKQQQIAMNLGKIHEK